jgi:hypothetical protein
MPRIRAIANGTPRAERNVMRIRICLLLFATAGCAAFGPLVAARSSASHCVSVGIDRGNVPTKLDQISLSLRVENGCDATTEFDLRRMRVRALGYGQASDLTLVNPPETLTLPGNQGVAVVAVYGPIDSSAERICVRAAGADLGEADRTMGAVGCIAVDRDRAITR